MKKIIAIALIVLLSIPALAHAKIEMEIGRKTVTAAGTAERLTAGTIPFATLDICAEDNNTGVIAVGNSKIVASQATRNGVYLNAGDCYTISMHADGKSVKIGDTYTIYIDATVSGDGVVWSAIMER